MFAVSFLFSMAVNAVEYETIFSEEVKWDHVRYEYAQRCCLVRDSVKIALDRRKISVGGKEYDIAEVGGWKIYKNGRTLMFSCIYDGYVDAYIKLCEYDNGIRLIIVREGKTGRMYWCSRRTEAVY